MEQKWKQILMAFVMGVIMPAAVLRFGLLFAPAGGGSETQPTQPIQTTGAEQPTLPAQVPGFQIPVRLDADTVKMSLEEYLLGVVLAEMPAEFEEEALKAQAVAARTCTLLCVEQGEKHPDGGVCTDPACCQAYQSPEGYVAEGGREAEVEKIRHAVEATEGQVLTYGGELIDATYFSCSGGRTEDAQAVWGTFVPYLQAVESPGEEKSDRYFSTVTYTVSQFAARLGRTLTGSPASWLGARTFTPGWGVATMVIAGQTYTGTQLRTLLDLNSTIFVMEAQEDAIVITTSGWGHRVGMSQYGADAMAVAGSTYEQILAYYYQGTRIDKWDTMQ